PLSLRDLLARRLRHHYFGLGVELALSLPWGAALGGADGVLRSLYRLRDDHRAAVRRHAEPFGHRRIPAWLAWAAELVVRAAVPDVHHLLYLDPRGDQPASVRLAGGGSGAGCGLSDGIFVDGVRALLPWRICQHDPDEQHLHGAVLGGLAAAGGLGDLHLDPGHRLVRHQGGDPAVRLRLGPGDAAALSL